MVEEFIAISLTSLAIVVPGIFVIRASRWLARKTPRVAVRSLGILLVIAGLLIFILGIFG